MRIKKYWDVSFENSAQDGRSDEDYIAEWSELFESQYNCD